jgi:drug/metabolite transporter (DMT)-like permease
MGANILFLLASRSGLLSLVAMISSLFPAPTVILARIFMKESIPPARAAGLGLALGGIALISLH